MSLDWNEWVLIKNSTLRDLNKDAAAKEIAERKFTSLQRWSVDLAERFNAISIEAHKLRNEKYDLVVGNWDLTHPPWYKSPWFWGATGAAVGMVAGGAFVAWASK